jgi:hypothetical protein
MPCRTPELRSDHESGHGDEPNPPSDLKVTEAAGAAHLTWKDNSNNEASFMLERKVGSGRFAVYKALDFDTTDYHDATVSTGVTYAYRRGVKTSESKNGRSALAS